MKKKPRRGKKNIDDTGRWNEVQNPFELACCDCGTVHDIEVKYDKDGISIRATVNARESNKLKKKRGVKTLWGAYY